MSDEMHVRQAESAERLVKTAGAVLRRFHRPRLHAGAGLAEEINCINSEINCESGHVLGPHCRGSPEAVQQYHGNPAVGPVLVQAHNTEIGWHIMHSIRRWAQRTHMFVNREIALP